MKYKGHDWTPERIRKDPSAAFALFEKDGKNYITVSELCFTARKTNAEHRRRGSLYNEMEIFHALDLDGDAIISRDEFVQVIGDPALFGDEALSCIATLCERKQEDKALADADTTLSVRILLDKAASSREDPEKSGSRNSMRPQFSRRMQSVRMIFEEPHDLVLSVIALDLQFTDPAWWDIAGLTENTSTSVYVVVKSNDNILAASEILDAQSTRTVAWKPLRILAEDLKKDENSRGASLKPLVLELRAKTSYVSQTFHNKPPDILIGISDTLSLPNFQATDIEAPLGSLALSKADDQSIDIPSTAHLLAISKWASLASRHFDHDEQDPDTLAQVNCDAFMLICPTVETEDLPEASDNQQTRVMV